MPEYIAPNGIDQSSLEYALYLTYIISIDFMTDAVKLWERARELYSKCPECFTPKGISDMGLPTLKRILRQLGARYPASGKAWKKISTILQEKYEGDPRNITPESTSLEELRKRIREFPHLRGSKLINFYIRAVGEKGFFKISDFDKLSVAVDIQVAKFTLYTGVLKIANGSYRGCVHDEPLKPMIEEVWSEVAQRLGKPPWYLDEPVWTVGSKLCSKKDHARCPVKELCEQRPDVKFQRTTVTLGLVKR